MDISVLHPHAVGFGGSAHRLVEALCACEGGNMSHLPRALPPFSHLSLVSISGFGLVIGPSYECIIYLLLYNKLSPNLVA